MAGGRALLGLLVGAVVVLCGWVGFGILRDRDETISAAFRHAANLADALGRQAAQTMAATDQALARLTVIIPPAAITDPGRRNTVFELLSDRQKRAFGSMAFFIVDGAGRLLHSSRRRDPAPTDLSGMSWFAEARDRADGEFGIGWPEKMPIGDGSEGWAIVVYRPVRDAEGRLLAVFASALSIEHVSRLHGALDVGPLGRISLFRDDGMLLANHPVLPKDVSRPRIALPVFQHRSRAASGQFSAVNPSDGVRRLVAYRSVEGYPLFVAVALEQGWVLAPWWARTLRGLAVLVLLLGTVAALVLHTRRLVAQRTAADREQTRRITLLARASLELARTRSAGSMLGAAAGLARSLVGAHQSVVQLTPPGGGAPQIQAVSLSDRYAQWRTYDEAPTGAGIYALVAERNQPMRLSQAELEAHPAWRAFGEAAGRHPPMRGWLAVPLVGQDGGNLGMIQLSDREAGDFTEDDEAICQQLALMLSTLIENLRSEEALAAALAAERAARADQEASRAEAERAGRRNDVILASISDAFFVLDRAFRFTYINAHAAALLGDRAAIGVHVWDAVRQAEGVLGPAFERSMARGEAVSMTFQHAPTRAWLDVRAYPFDEGLSVYFRDVTEKVETEARLVQARKMEAVGQLTGGIAHDFNNLLTVILGMGDAILAGRIDDPQLRERIESMVAAGDRGAQLTSSLLAFSRRHPLTPRATDVAHLLQRIEAMLSPTLGGGIGIEVVTSGSLWPAMVDLGQLELAVVNLAINARDAMPGGGRLTIEAANARLDEAYAHANPEAAAGQYVMIAVSDTGTGMSAETVAHAFEPFFTTKDVGKGSGLGLSMVYGFVRQSGGHVKIYSEPGLGTTVKLYLPRAIVPGGDPRQQGSPPVRPPGGNESVLVVEDGPEVRDLFVRSLRALGYGVTEAASGPQALERMKGARFDLLLTDLVLPGGLGGRELAAEARRRQPGLPILYTSGYAENASIHHGRIEPGERLLRKPFRHADLARLVRLTLGDGPAAG